MLQAAQQLPVIKCCYV